jgi:hypothetical protein
MRYNVYCGMNKIESNVDYERALDLYLDFKQRLGVTLVFIPQD